jgi:hypothetical protein
MSKADVDLAEFVGQFWDDPLGFTIAAYEWDTDPELQICKLQPPWSMIYNTEFGPDAWACEMLDRVGRAIREHGFDGAHAVKAIREAVASGHGIGKSALVAWLVCFIMSTRPHAHGTVTANTGDQLSAKTWAEIAKWNKRCLTGHWFNVTSGRGAMKMEHKDFPESWYCRAQTWREENSEAFAGQHAASSTSFYIFDEASNIADVIWDVADGGLTDGEPMWFAFGNPTRNTGRFKDCFDDKRWTCTQIDSRKVQITNKEYIDELIAVHGENSDYAKIRIRGEFPSASSYQFFTTENVDLATQVHLRAPQYSHAPVILTLDPAWTGDDELVFAKRQGLRFEVLRTIDKNDDDVKIATILAQMEDDHHADAVFVDFGYGTGIVSAGRAMNRHWQLVNFGSASPEPGFLNMRAWMYEQARKWLKAGGAIDPKDKRLYKELISIETVPRLDGKVQIEGKKELKLRLGKDWSPNRLDCLVMSFAFPVTKRSARNVPIEQRVKRAKDYDPHALMG